MQVNVLLFSVIIAGVRVCVCVCVCVCVATLDSAELLCFGSSYVECAVDGLLTKMIVFL